MIEKHKTPGIIDSNDKNKDPEMIYQFNSSINLLNGSLKIRFKDI